MASTVQRTTAAHQAGGLTLPAQVEKYRPKNIDDVVGNAEAVSRLQVIGREGNFPNVILAVRAAQAVPFPSGCCCSLHWTCVTL